MVRIFLKRGICCPHAADEFRDQAVLHLDECERICSRMAEGIVLFEDVERAMRAYGQIAIIRDREPRVGSCPV